MVLQLIDSHAHVSGMENGEQVVERAQTNGISAIINVCTDAATLEKGFQMTEKYPFCFNAAATTPHDVEKEGEKNFALFARCAKERKIIALGESGLDYFYKHSEVDTQQKFLKKYFRLAQETRLPIILHCRDAFADLLAIGDENYSQNDIWGKTLLHCFTGSMQNAEALLLRGCMLSFSGVITYPKNDKLREVVKEVPLNRILIESDAPYLAPQKYRGQINEPAYIVETSKCIAGVKGIELEEVAKATVANTKSFFGITI